MRPLMGADVSTREDVIVVGCPSEPAVLSAGGQDGGAHAV